jgi:hypothetical protein
MHWSPNRGKLMYSRLAAPFAQAALGNAVNRDGLAKCSIQLVFLPLLRQSQHLMCFHISMQYIESSMPLPVALVSIRNVSKGLSFVRSGHGFV